MGMTCILLTSAAQRDYKRLPRNVQQAVKELLDGDFHTNPLAPQFNARKVKVPFTGYRMRLGSYRILFELGKCTIIVYRIRHRKDAYK